MSRRGISHVPNMDDILLPIDCTDEKTAENYDWESVKRRDILQACHDFDIGALKTLAKQRGGFLDDSIRNQAWPILLGSPALFPLENNDGPSTTPWQDLPAHKDEAQVSLDVKRAFIYYPSDRPHAELEKCKEELLELITEVLRRHPYLCYFQGYHDICQVFLLVLRPAWRASLVTRLSLLRIRDFMLPTLGPTVAQLNLLPEIIARADPELRCHVSSIQPFYALAGTLTMYAHNIQDYSDIARLFDVLLSHGPVFSLYLFAQLVLDRRAELLDTPADDTTMLHFILSKIPQKLDLERLITASVILLENHHPESLSSWRRLSRFSVLRTANSVELCALQTLEQGHGCFSRQTKELQWAEARAKVRKAMRHYRGPLSALSLAFGVGLLAVYLRGNPGLANRLARVLARYMQW